MDVASVVAANIKAIREQKKPIPDAVAELTGVFGSMLTQIEKGDVNPTISVLWKIANGYKVSFTSPVEKKADSVTVIGQCNRKPLEEDDGRYLNYPIKVLKRDCRRGVYV